MAMIVRQSRKLVRKQNFWLQKNLQRTFIKI